MSADDETPAEAAARKAHWARIAAQGDHPAQIAALSELARTVLPNADIEFWSLGSEQADEPTICVHNASKVPDEAWYALDGVRLLGREVFATVVFNGKTGENLGAYITLTENDEAAGEDDDVDGGFLLVPFNQIGSLPEVKRYPNLLADLTEAAGLIHEIDPGLQVMFFLTDGDDAFKRPTVLGMNTAQADHPRYWQLAERKINGREVLIQIGSFDEVSWNVWLTLDFAEKP